MSGHTAPTAPRSLETAAFPGWPWGPELQTGLRPRVVVSLPSPEVYKQHVHSHLLGMPQQGVLLWGGGGATCCSGLVQPDIHASSAAAQQQTGEFCDLTPLGFEDPGVRVPRPASEQDPVRNLGTRLSLSEPRSLPLFHGKSGGATSEGGPGANWLSGQVPSATPGTQ